MLLTQGRGTHEDVTGGVCKGKIPRNGVVNTKIKPPFRAGHLEPIGEEEKPTANSMPNSHHPALKPASYKLVATRVNVFATVHVDQRQTRAVHNCFLGCPFNPEYGCQPKSGTALLDDSVRKANVQERFLAESPFICRAIHYGFCTVVALPPGVIPRGDEDIDEKRKNSDLFPGRKQDEPDRAVANYPDLAKKVEPSKSAIKIISFPDLARGSNLPDLVTSNDVTEIVRNKSVAVDLANNNVDFVDKKKKSGDSNESTRTKADISDTAKSNVDSSSTKQKKPPKLFQEQHEANRKSKSQEVVNVPQFYFPFGKPVPNEENEAVIKKLSEVFKTLPDQKADKPQMDKITQVCKCPLYWRVPLYNAAGGETAGFVTAQAFIAMWRRITKECHDDASRFFRLLARPGMNYLTSEDFIPFVQDIVNSHPGLTFLQDAPEFHSRYITTVVARIFYVLNRSWTGRITLPELRRSNLLSVISLLEEEDDINQVTDYFSYEHFYVIYCKFWELDTDHDLYIDKKDLSRHQDHAISSRMIDRIFSPGTVLSPSSVREGRMSYNEFVWFLISEEDKKTAISMEYWFRCLDLDGDGYLSMYELEYFYEEQLNKMESLGIETLPFEDCLCQLLDLVKPRCPDYITLQDLKNCKLAYIFFDTLFNLEKFLDHEQRDPFATNRDYENEGPEPSDWEKYALEEYELLVAEEGGQDTQAQSIQGEDGDYADDFETDEDIITIDLRQKATITEPGSEPQRNKWIGDGGDAGKSEAGL